MNSDSNYTNIRSIDIARTNKLLREGLGFDLTWEETKKCECVSDECVHYRNRKTELFGARATREIEDLQNRMEERFNDFG